MSLIRLHKHLLPRLNATRLLNTSAQNDEYTAVPHYPEILDLSYEARKQRKHESKCEEIKAVKTVEEKQIKLNMPRYYGFKCHMFQEDIIPYDNLQLAQHITRTHLAEVKGLPESYKDVEVGDGVVKKVKAMLEEDLLVELEGYKKKYDLKAGGLTPSDSELENKFAQSMSERINRTITTALVEYNKHLLDLQINTNPRIESFWFAGGINPPESIKRMRRGSEWQKDRENEPVDRGIQYTGKPMLSLNSEHPLKPIIPYSDATNTDLHVPHFKYDPRVVGITTTHQHAVNTPGFWPGDSHHFAFISFHNRGHLLERSFDELYPVESLHRQGILASFAWLNAQANFLGFTTFNDITYPLVTQTVITNGREFSFYTYQLNTMVINDNPKRNVCFASPQMKLFESIQGNKIIGFNEDVLVALLKYYTNAPVERLGLNLTPYLSSEAKYSSGYADQDKREWLEREYKFLVSNRPRYKLNYEVYHWEKIYKIDHKTRPMEPRRRPFELFTNPYKRTLDDRQAKYIPRALRPDLPRNKGRYAKEYFP